MDGGDLGIVLFMILAVFVCVTFIMWMGQHSGKATQDKQILDKPKSTVPNMTTI